MTHVIRYAEIFCQKKYDTYQKFASYKKNYDSDKRSIIEECLLQKHIRRKFANKSKSGCVKSLANKKVILR